MGRSSEQPLDILTRISECVACNLAASRKTESVSETCVKAKSMNDDDEGKLAFFYLFHLDFSLLLLWRNGAFERLTQKEHHFVQRTCPLKY